MFGEGRVLCTGHQTLKNRTVSFSLAIIMLDFQGRNLTFSLNFFNQNLLKKNLQLSLKFCNQRTIKLKTVS